MNELNKQKVAFGKAIAERIRSKDCFENVQFDASENLIKIFKDGSVNRSLNLETLFRDVQLIAEDDRARYIDRRIHSMLIDPVPEFTDMTFAEALPSLKPMLRPRVIFENFRLQLMIEALRDKKPEVEFADDGFTPYIELGEHFGVGLAFDFPDKRMEISASVLKHWGIEINEAIFQAQSNLEPAEGDAFGQIQPGLWVSICEDTYDSTRILIPDLIRCYPVNGDPVALIVSRDIVFITGSKDVANVCELPALADTAYETHVKTFRERPIVLNENDMWEYWYAPDLGLPEEISEWFEDNETAALSYDYGEQAELLREIFLLQGKTIVVADVGVLEGDGQKLTICKWDSEFHTSLPYCQLIAMPVNTEDYAVASLIELLEVFPDYFEETEYYPPRLHVDRCLNETELQSFLERYPDTPIVKLEF